MEREQNRPENRKEREWDTLLRVGHTDHTATWDEHRS